MTNINQESLTTLEYKNWNLMQILKIYDRSIIILGKRPTYSVKKSLISYMLNMTSLLWYICMCVCVCVFIYIYKICDLTMESAHIHMCTIQIGKDAPIFPVTFCDICI